MNKFNVGSAYYPKSPMIQQPKQANRKQTHLHQTGGANQFAQQLQEAVKTKSLTFSQHAQNRLSERGIDLSPEHIERLEQGLSKAESKGAKESLMLMEELAFVVSVKNRTVITAMETAGMSDQIVTNIDSAVLL